MTTTKKNSKATSLPVNSITVDPRLQMRPRINEDVLAEYTEIAKAHGFSDSFPVVFYDGTTYWLADGHYRLEAFKRAGLKNIKCDVREGTFRDAWLFALQANRGHGLRRDGATVSNCIQATMDDKELRAFTANALAQLIGCHVETVRKVRRLHPDYKGEGEYTPKQKTKGTPIAPTPNKGKGAYSPTQAPLPEPPPPVPAPAPAPPKPKPYQDPLDAARNPKSKKTPEPEAASTLFELPTEPSEKPDVDADDVDALDIPVPPTESVPAPDPVAPTSVASNLKPVPAHLRDVFHDLPAWDEILWCLSRASRLMRKLEEQPIASRCVLDPLIFSLREVNETLQNYRPVGICVRCRGESVNAVGTCKSCFKAGYLVQRDLKNFDTDEQREITHGYDLASCHPLLSEVMDEEEEAEDAES